MNQVELVVKNLPSIARDKRGSSSIRELGRSPGERKGHPVQDSCLENSMDRGAWQATVCGVPKNRTRLSHFHFHFSLVVKTVTSESGRLLANLDSATCLLCDIRLVPCL